MKIAFGVCSLGIGHATRSIPLIKALINEGHEIVIISYDRALALLKKEFPELKFYNLPDYPIKYTQKAHQFLPYFILNTRKIFKTLFDMHKLFLEIDERENFDIIISDSRYDIFNRFKPSYLIIHQLRIMMKAAVLRGGIMFYNSYMSKYFKKIVVPDFEENGLTGEMSHNLKFIDGGKVKYIGVLSPFRHRSLERDIDVLISISGPEPQRTIFEEKVMESIGDLNGKIVITLGRPEKEDYKRENVEIYSYLSSNKREEIMNRSKLVISRSGYSTIMDLYAIGGKAMFVPTPGQPEQRYLAQHLQSMGIAGYVSQDNLNLANLVKESEKYRGFEGGYDVSKSVENFLRVISDGD